MAKGNGWVDGATAVNFQEQKAENGSGRTHKQQYAGREWNLGMKLQI